MKLKIGSSGIAGMRLLISCVLMFVLILSAVAAFASQPEAVNADNGATARKATNDKKTTKEKQGADGFAWSLDAALKAVTEHPDNAANLYALGVAYEDIGNLPAAESSYISAISIDPNNDLARYRLGLVYAAESKFNYSRTETETAALNSHGVITIAEYRGKTHLRSAFGSHRNREIDGYDASEAEDSKQDIRLGFDSSKTLDDRIYRDESKAFDIGLLGGYQKNSQNSMIVTGGFGHIRYETPRPLEFDGYMDTASQTAGIAYRKKFGVKSTVYVRAGQDKLIGNLEESDNNLLEKLVNGNKSLELRDDIQYSDKVNIVLGGFIAKTDNNLLTQFESFCGCEEDLFIDHYRQKNAYFITSYKYSSKLNLSAGAENVYNDKAGSRVLSRFGAEYRPDQRSFLRFINKETLQMAFTPLFRPLDNWMYSDDSSLAEGNESKTSELNYEKIIADGSFLKINLFKRKIWGYRSEEIWLQNAEYDFSSPIYVTVEKGYKAFYQTRLSKKTNAFVAAAHGDIQKVEYKTDYYYSMSDYKPPNTISAGLFYLPDSKITVKVEYTRYGKRCPIDYPCSGGANAHSLTDFQLRYEPISNRLYSLTVKNVFNKNGFSNYISDYESYPGPGRRYEISAERWF